jgi:hypothetical protein
MKSVRTRQEGFCVSNECIHGFVDGLCATCNPKPVPEVAVVIKPATRTRTSSSPRGATVRSLRAAARIPAGSTPADNLLEQRIYHITHLSNLPAILASGALVGGSLPTLDLLPADLRGERSEIAITASPETVLTDYVPFFLTPDAQLWQELRAGREHARLSNEAGAADALDFIFLVSTVRHVIDIPAQFVVADRHSEDVTTRFASTQDDAQLMLHRLRANDDGEQLLDAELLVAGQLPLESINLIGVANDRVRQSVRDMLATSAFTPKVAVYPPWFQQAE